jgi:hypothetical protein
MFNTARVIYYVVLNDLVSTYLCNTLESVSICMAISGRYSTKAMGASPYCLAGVAKMTWQYCHVTGQYCQVLQSDSAILPSDLAILPSTARSLGNIAKYCQVNWQCCKVLPLATSCQVLFPQPRFQVGVILRWVLLLGGRQQQRHNNNTHSNMKQQ